MTKTEAISRMIIEEFGYQMRVNPNGKHAAIKIAIDKVLGAGRYDQIVSDIYDELRAA